MSRSNRKEQILEAAVTTFFNKGYGSATTAEIAVLAGVSEGTIFRYFKTKKSLLLEIMDRLLARFANILIVQPIQEIALQNRDQEPDIILRKLLQDRFELLNRHADMLWIVFTEMQYHPELKQKVAEHIMPRMQSVSEMLFRPGIERGTFRDVNPLVITRCLLGAVLFTTIQHNLLPQSVTQNREREIDEIVDLIFRGIRKECEP